MRFERLIAGLLLALAALAGPLAAKAQAPAHVQARLVSETVGAAPGSVLYIALDQRIDPGWHTYWRNPGDAGQATAMRWTLPAGWRAGDIVWPAPERLPLGPLMNYGYRGEVLLPAPIEVPASARPGTTQHIAANVSFLACADVCVPEDAQVTLDVPVVAGAPPVDPRWGALVARTLMRAPKPSGLSAAFQIAGGRLRLAIGGRELAARATPAAYFYPYQGGVIDQAAAQAIDLGHDGLTFNIPLSADLHGVPARVEGVVETGDGAAYEISAAPGPPPAGASGLGAPRPPPAAMGLGPAMGLAFLGGLILNLMPCVLPVLAMKAATFAGHGGETAGARAQGLAFLVGVMTCFLALAGALMAARAAGAAVGWGFQLQSPAVVGGLALVMLAAALNLSGVYELGTSVQGVGAGLASRPGLLGAGLTGALAVVVAAPCTSPFMGPAVGYALTQSPAAALAVFAALGLGFSLPFVALAFSPALIRRLPRPGTWMTALRQALAFPMYAAAAWLAWVVSRQAGGDGLASLFAAALVLAVGAWLWGAAQARQRDGKPWRRIAAPALLAVALALAFVSRTPLPTPAAASAPTPGASGLTAQPYSPDRLAALRAAGTPVLVNFTAAWCVTCQVNERVALDAAEVAVAFRRAGAVYMVGDWTNRDGVIAQALAEQGRAGVPLYLVYGADGGAPKVLPQLLTPGLVAAAVQAAAVRPPAAAGR